MFTIPASLSKHKRPHRRRVHPKRTETFYLAVQRRLELKVTAKKANKVLNTSIVWPVAVPMWLDTISVQILHFDTFDPLRSIGLINIEALYVFADHENNLDFLLWRRCP
jgi:hypothetical protein